MKSMLKASLLSCIVMLAFSASLAGDKQGTPTEAIAFVQKAIDFIKAKGTAKAFAEFSNRNGQFIDRDLYISVYDLNGVCVAHPDPKKNKKDLLNETDSNGKMVIKERLAIAKEQGKGWATYKGKSLQNDNIVDKSVYLEKYEKYIVCCAVYGFVQ